MAWGDLPGTVSETAPDAETKHERREHDLIGYSQASEGSLVDVARADTVDAELDRLISKRASQDRGPDPDEQEELWKASVRAHNARRSEEMRAAWCEYHQRQAERHRSILEALISEHEAKAMKLRKGTPWQQIR